MNISEKDRALLHELFSKCGPLFIAMGDEIRQKLILDILDAGEGGINVMTLAAGSKLSRPAISHHLKILKDSGVVSCEKQGTQAFYHLSVHKKFPEVESLINSTIRLIEEVNSKERKCKAENSESNVSSAIAVANNAGPAGSDSSSGTEK